MGRYKIKGQAIYGEVYQIKGRKALFHDPEIGKIYWISFSKLEKCYEK